MPARLADPRSGAGENAGAGIRAVAISGPLWGVSAGIDAAAEIVAALRFPGWWRQFSTFLLTVAASCEHPPPTALDAPPALAAGAPTHSWMAAPLADASAFSPAHG